MNERTSKAKDLLLALVLQIPEMGHFSIEKEDNISELLWSLFRYQGTAPELSTGLYIYQYDCGDYDLPNYDARLTSIEGDLIYLYQIETEE